MSPPSEGLLDGLRLVLVARADALAEAWTTAAADLPNVSVHRGQIGETAADAVVSPANSFGLMDGGLDARHVERYGLQVQVEASRAILERHHGELLVGQADIVPTGVEEHPWLIVAPTMRVPMALPATTVNPFLAMRAVLLLWRDGVVSSGENAGVPVRQVVQRIAVPGLGTGVGQVRPEICARQVRQAIEVVSRPDRLPTSSTEAARRHHALYADSPGDARDFP